MAGRGEGRAEQAREARQTRQARQAGAATGAAGQLWGQAEAGRGQTGLESGLKFDLKLIKLNLYT